MMCWSNLATSFASSTNAPARTLIVVSESRTPMVLSSPGSVWCLLVKICIVPPDEEIEVVGSPELRTETVLVSAVEGAGMGDYFLRDVSLICLIEVGQNGKSSSWAKLICEQGREVAVLVHVVGFGDT